MLVSRRSRRERQAEVSEGRPSGFGSVPWPQFDYERQAWVENGRYVRCGHPATMQCQCYGRLHEGEEVAAPRDPLAGLDPFERAAKDKRVW